MSDITQLKSKETGTVYDIKDATSRINSTNLLTWEECDRAVMASTGGRNIADIPEFASAITSAGSIYAFLHARASAANFAGLRLGDYINVPCGIYGTRRFEIAGFDTYYQCGDTAMGHHIVFVDSSPVAIPASDEHACKVNTSYLMWNATATNQGTADENCPYLASGLHDWEINNFLPAFPSALQGYMLERREWLETRYSASGNLNASTGAAWKSMGKIWSLSEMEVYGTVVWGTPGYTVGISRQLPLFAINPKKNLNGSRVIWWLRSVSGSSASHVCYVRHYGIASYNSATYDWCRPRCGFLLG